jgi:hypothetical protein
MRQFLGGGILAVGLLSTAGSVGETIDIVSSRDNTLYETGVATTLSNGAGDYFFAGKTGFRADGKLRRGLLAFDVAEVVPTGATINAVSLTLNVSRIPPGASPTVFELHRLLNDWGEGASNAPGQEGAGTSSFPGDATWHHTFFPGTFWTSPGGEPGADFEANASASKSVGGLGSYTWNSTPDLVFDVQGWLDQPDDDFGWLILGGEGTDNSARRFDSRQNSEADDRPTLHIDFTMPITGDHNQDGIVDAADLAIVLAGWETFGVEGLSDLFGETPAPSAPLLSAVPEPSTFLLALLGLLGGCLRRRRFAG